MPDSRPVVLDEIDRQLIAALQINARESVAMLARQLGIARTTVTSRLARLEKSKVITGYGVRLGTRLADGGLQAYVGIKVQPRSGKDVLRRLSAMAQVQQLCAVSGEFDYVAWLRTDSPEQLDQLLDQIGSVDGVENSAQQAFLAAEGCEQMQGYIVSLPLPPELFATTFLRRSIEDFSDSTVEKPSL